ncbi:unnamed protein product [Symbiodinium sp. KB8]|nr:unnamed protein product [Symbiodinium sp. KB8]
MDRPWSISFAGVTCDGWSTMGNQARFGHASELPHNVWVVERLVRGEQSYEDVAFLECTGKYPAADKLSPLRNSHQVLHFKCSPLQLGYPVSRPRVFAACLNLRTTVWVGPENWQDDFMDKFGRDCVVAGDSLLVASDEERYLEYEQLAAQQKNFISAKLFKDFSDDQCLSSMLTPGQQERVAKYIECRSEYESPGGHLLFDADHHLEARRMAGPHWPCMLTHGTIISAPRNGPKLLATALEHFGAQGLHLFRASSVDNAVSPLKPILQTLKIHQLKNLSGRGVHLGVLSAFMWYVLSNTVPLWQACPLRHSLSWDPVQAVDRSCFISFCDNRKVGKHKCCGEHKKVVDAILYQADKAGKKAEVERVLSDPNQAAKPVRDFEAENPPGKFRKKLIDFTQWLKTYSTETANISRDRLECYTFQDFSDEKTAAGWDPKVILDRWQEKQSDPSIEQEADGSLWLPMRKQKIRDDIKRISQSVVESSKQMKNAKPADVEALKQFASTSAASHNHAFLRGSNKDASEKAGSGVQTTSTGEPLVEVEGSGDNKDPNGKKAKGKKVDLAQALPTLHEKESTQLQRVKEQLTVACDKADEAVAMAENHKKSQSLSRSGEAFLETCVFRKNCAAAWFIDTQAALDAWLEKNKDSLPAEPADAVQPETLHGKVTAALQKIATSKGPANLPVQEVPSLHCYLDLEGRCQAVLQLEDVAALDKHKADMKKYIGAANQLRESLAKASSKMTGHLDNIEREAVRAQKKEAGRKEKEAVAKAKATAKKAAQNVQKEKKEVPPLFSIDLAKFPEVTSTVVTDEAVKAADFKFDHSKPALFGASVAEKDWGNNPKVQMALSAYGGQYKAQTTTKDSGKGQTNLRQKAGKEESEQVLKETWLYGYLPETTFASPTPQGLSMLKTLAAGDVRVFAIELAALQRCLKKNGLALDADCADNVLQFDADALKAFVASGCPVYHLEVKQFETIYIPTGYLVLERSGSAVLVYGMRKSFCLKGDEKKYEHVVEYVKAIGKDASRYEKCLESIKTAASEAAATGTP